MAWSGNTDRLEVLATEEDGAGMTVKIRVSGGNTFWKPIMSVWGKQQNIKIPQSHKMRRKCNKLDTKDPLKKNIEFCFSIIRVLP